MQANLERGRAASGARSVSRFAILAGVPFIAALALSNPALAACGTSHPAGVHAATTSTGVHAATSTVTSGAGGGGGVGTLGCANGSSATAPHGLATAASGKVIEGGVHSATRTATHSTTATKSTNATAHLRAAKPAHHA